MADAILTVKHLNKSYGHQPVLRDVSFECTQGRIVGLVGANGAGKTTIMKAILGLLSTDGEIQIAGETMQLDHHPNPSDSRVVDRVSEPLPVYERLGQFTVVCGRA